MTSFVYCTDDEKRKQITEKKNQIYHDNMNRRKLIRNEKRKMIFYNLMDIVPTGSLSISLSIDISTAVDLDKNRNSLGNKVLP